jgi:hypothetical protein
MALDTVADYVRDARVLLQDTVADYRYSDSELVEALNLGLLEIRRLRPELVRSYFRTSLPTYSSTAMSTAVSMDYQYRVPLLYYICGHAQLRDDENTQDARATIFLNKFTAQMLAIQS